jgi:hypothetical protein
MEKKIQEKIQEGNLDLPQSIGLLIARLLQQKFPSEAVSTKRDGTLIITFNNRDKMKHYKTIELEYNSLYFRYELIDTEIISAEVNCTQCGGRYIKTTYHALYDLKEIWQGRHNLTERYKIGGDLTESAVGISAIKKQEMAQPESQQKLLFYT